MSEKTIDTDIVVVGAGGCGLTAALVAAEHGVRVLLLESDSIVGGTTSMSAGLFVAAGSRLQHTSGAFGMAEELAEDIFRLNENQSNPEVTLALCRVSGPLMDWLEKQGVPLEHIAEYKYVGMSKSWLHGPPQRDGSVITNALYGIIRNQPAIDLRLNTTVTGLIADVDSVNGVRAVAGENLGLKVHAKAVILAASGFGANPNLVAQYIPELTGMPYYGAPYANGEAIAWGVNLGAALDHMSAYQAHSSIAYPKPMLVTTYLINHGGIQVNLNGHRFGDETDTYSRHAAAVQRQPEGFVVEIFDEIILRQTLANYPRFGECIREGIVFGANTLTELATGLGINRENLVETVIRFNAAVAAGSDQFGRTQFGHPLTAPFYGIKVTSALVQTLGGLQVDSRARVQLPDGSPVGGLYAGGGTAAGLAGDRSEGYLAGTGLLSAFGLGWIAAQDAAGQIMLNPG